VKKLIVANWKMNPSTEKEAKELFDTVKAAFAKASASQRKGIEVVICPPFVYLSLLKGITLGAQNVFYKEQGSFTGEVSPLMLKDLKVKYVIVGHSESRKNLNETDEIINKKVKEVLAVELKPILCVGENEGESKSEVLEKQITQDLKNVSEKDLKNVVIAYEPIWAIGTGNNCSIEETIISVLMIKKIIAKLYSEKIVENMKILYGGSVNSQNSAEYIKNREVDGLLVGGASLNAEEFVKIIKLT